MRPGSACRKIVPEEAAEVGEKEEVKAPVRLHVPVSSRSRQIVSPEVEADSTLSVDPSIFGIWKRMSDDYFGHGPSAWYLSSSNQVSRGGDGNRCNI